VLIKLRNLFHLFTIGGKAGDRDHLWPKLNTYQLIIFTKDMNIGVMRSICTSFAADIMVRMRNHISQNCLPL
jgi:hypothetical protein